jgi:hypothetical protein
MRRARDLRRNFQENRGQYVKLEICSQYTLKNINKQVILIFEMQILIIVYFHEINTFIS